MRYYQHTITKTDLFIGSDTPYWLNTHVDGRYSKERRTPLYCRLVPTGEIALIHSPKWVYTDYLVEINEEEARQLDSTLVDRIARIECGGEEPRYRKTKHYGYLQGIKTPQS